MINVIDRSDYFIHKCIDHVTKEQAECADDWLRHRIRYGYINQNIRGSIVEYTNRSDDNRWFYHLSYDVNTSGTNDADFYNKTMEMRKMMNDIANSIVEHLDGRNES